MAAAVKQGRAKLPKLCHHRASGRGYVWLDGRRHYLGPWGEDETREAYERLLAQWLAGGRALPVAPTEITVAEILARYWRHAESYYRRPDGGPSRELDCLRYALRPLKDLYASTPAAAFGAGDLKAIREAWARGHVRGQRRPAARSRINRDMHRVKRVFRWAVAEELLPAGVYEVLRAVPALRKGRTDARETEPVRPVPQEHVDAIRPYVSRQVRALIDLQLLTAARPGELLALRPCDVEREGEVWTYRPTSHKTAHWGDSRTILLGPEAQAILRPFLLRDAGAFCFSPAEAVAEHLAAVRKREGHGPHKRAYPRRQPGLRYTTASYAAAIARGCAKASAKRAKEGLPPIPRWGPHRLRHTRATEIRAQHGIEAAQTLLGHRLGSAVTEVYAEASLEAARRIVAKEG